MKEEQSKGLDPCEEGMECMQNKEIRKKTNTKALKKYNWKHEEVIPEADGPTITPDRNWNPDRPQDQEQTNNVDLINEHIRYRTQDPKARAQEEEEEKKRTQELYEDMKQIQLLEAQGKTYEYEPYDPMEAFTESLQKPIKKGECPMNVVRAVRILQGPEG